MRDEMSWQQLIWNWSAVAVSRSMAQCFMVATAVTVWGEKSFVRFVWCLVKFIEQEMSKFDTVCVSVKSECMVVVRRSTFLFRGRIPDSTGQVQISQLSVNM